MNAAAEAVFDNYIRVQKGRLIVRDKQAASALQCLSDQLRATPATDSIPAKPILVRREAKAPVLVRILPISGPAENPFVGARALLTLTELRPKQGPDPNDISVAFGLTQAEARLASLIVSGSSPEEAASRLGISVATARNQLKSTFAKTGTHRQSSFVALLSRL